MNDAKGATIRFPGGGGAGFVQSGQNIFLNLS